METTVTDIEGRRQFWFNAQPLVAEAEQLAVVQQRPARHPANPILVAHKP